MVQACLPEGMTNLFISAHQGRDDSGTEKIPVWLLSPYPETGHPTRQTQRCEVREQMRSQRPPRPQCQHQAWGRCQHKGPRGLALAEARKQLCAPSWGLTAWISKINTQDAHSHLWLRLWKSYIESVNVCIHEALDPERAMSPVGIFTWLFENSPPYMMGFPGGSDGKESACNSEDPGSSPGPGRSPGRRE